VHHGSLDDPRVEIRIGDGWDTTAGLVAAGERFDLVVLDLTDPDTPAHRLYTTDYFQLVRQVLAGGGALALHIGSPVYRPDRVRALLADLKQVFPIVRPLGVHVPLYGAYWGMAVASDHLDPLAIDSDQVADRIKSRQLADLRYYNEAVHAALFALPNFYRALLL
jgi:spermidine synthase